MDPKVNKFLHVSSSLPAALSIPNKIFESKQFLPLSNSICDNDPSTNLLSSLVIMCSIAASLPLSPDNFKPNNPVSRKCQLIALALSKLGSLYIMLIVVRECIPLPGPPEDQDSVEPKIYLSI